jgi:hypothetical protein
MIAATVVRITAMTVATAAMTATTAVRDPVCCADSPMGESCARLARPGMETSAPP